MKPSPDSSECEKLMSAWKHLRSPINQKQNHPPQQLLSVQIRQELLNKDVGDYQGMCKSYICESALATQRMMELFIQLRSDFTNAASDDSLYCHGQKAGDLILSLLEG